MSSIFFKRKLSGRDYRIKVFRFVKRCQITLQDIITSSTWKGSFDMACIETMTQKTGRFMPFEMFFSLLLSSLRGVGGEAELAVMTFRDLQNLFKEEVGDAVARQMDQQNRRYLILTMRQPMITHYPLPLLYSRDPDTELMAMTKHEMQVHKVESSSPRQGTPRQSPAPRRAIKKSSRSEDSRSQRSRKISFGRGDFLERVMGEHIEKALNESFGSSPSPQKRISKIAADRGADTIGTLRLELRQQARDYKREVTRLQRDNEHLRRRIQEMKLREMELSADVARLTEQQRLNIAASHRLLNRAHSASPATARRRAASASSSTSRISHSPRLVRSMFNFFDGDQAGGRTRRRRSSPAVGGSGAAADHTRRLADQSRSKSLDDARNHCCRQHRCRCPGGGAECPEAPPNSGDGERRRPRTSGWVPFDPTEYVSEQRRAARQRSLERASEREMLQRRRPLRLRRAGRRVSRPRPEPMPAGGWVDVGDSAVVGMRQLETRLKNLQRMLSEKID